MRQGRIVFAQVLDFFPKHEFDKCVRRYGGNRRVRQFSCFDQFLSMACAQITGRESLRDIETRPRAMGPKLYHAGFRGKNSRSTLADANDLFRCRWQVELFFKWIKQHLRIKAFFGTSQNAVHTQIWIALCVYVLVSILKKRLKLALSIYTILQILGVTLFENMPILQALWGSECKEQKDDDRRQLDLFNF